MWGLIAGVSMSACRLVPEPDASTAMSMGGPPGRARRQCTAWPAGSGRRLTSTRIGAVTGYTEVPAAQWEEWVVDNDATVLDVREPDEWRQGTLPGALLMSQGEVVARIAEIPKERPVLCVCRSGGRSANVAAFLSFNGFEVANLAGGMKLLGMQD
jgi:rhodanese-related sulfurtransferase